MLLALFEFALQPSWLAVWFWVLCLIALVWARRHLDLNRARREVTTLPKPTTRNASPSQGEGRAGVEQAIEQRAPALPKLTVLVAGKDEEANIGACLAGLLAQQYPDLQVIVADDRSTDRTGAIIDEVAARDPRVQTVHIQHLADGWAGKNHALHEAVPHAQGEWLCFTDADCRFHDRDLLTAAVTYAEANGIEFLSVLPDLEAHTFWERVVQPPAGAIMVFWFPPDKVNNPASSRAYANGAFMLMRRSAYERLGGHAAVRNALNEDMHFARRAKQLGVRLQVIRGGGMYSVRMYVGLRQIWNGWTRIFYASFGTLPRLFVSVIFLSVFSLLPTVSLILSPLLGAAAAGVAIAAAGAILIQQTVLWRFYALSNTQPAWALTWPLGAGLCLAMTLNAIRRHAGGKTKWRGTTYTGGN